VPCGGSKEYSEHFPVWPLLPSISCCHPRSFFFLAPSFFLRSFGPLLCSPQSWSLSVFKFCPCRNFLSSLSAVPTFILSPLLFAFFSSAPPPFFNAWSELSQGGFFFVPPVQTRVSPPLGPSDHSFDPFCSLRPPDLLRWHSDTLPPSNGPKGFVFFAHSPSAAPSLPLLLATFRAEAADDFLSCLPLRIFIFPLSRSLFADAVLSSFSHLLLLSLSSPAIGFPPSASKSPTSRVRVVFTCRTPPLTTSKKNFSLWGDTPISLPLRSQCSPPPASLPLTAFFSRLISPCVYCVQFNSWARCMVFFNLHILLYQKHLSCPRLPSAICKIHFFFYHTHLAAPPTFPSPRFRSTKRPNNPWNRLARSLPALLSVPKFYAEQLSSSRICSSLFLLPGFYFLVISLRNIPSTELWFPAQPSPCAFFFFCLGLAFFGYC